MEDNKILARPVTIAGKTYSPGDDLPDDVAAKIRNPKAWIPAGEVTEPVQAGPAGTRSGHRLATTVTIGGKAYSPDDFLPDDVAAKIRNPKAWEGGVLPNLATADADTAEAGGDAESGEGAEDSGDAGGAGGEGGGQNPPAPVTGAGSTEADKRKRK